MDGIHDLGGKQGYGPVAVDETDVPFHHEWEGREWGISRTARVPGINIDWWRHCRELIMPEDYLGRPYFDSWAQTDFATYLNAGVLSMEEVISGKAIPGRLDNDEQAPVLTMEQAIQADRNSAVRFDAEIEASPLFSIGQEIITSKHGHEHHTRLPQYARGRCGRVHDYNGAHIFPDLSSQGEKTWQHLYTIVFEGSELWPGDEGRNNKIYLDLWESYLAAI
ncbi:MAG: nitrile hydratase subunit beta [Gammaproteobacteria bacterium]